MIPNEVKEVNGRIVHIIDQFVKCKVCNHIAGKGYVISGDGFYCYHCHLKKLKELKEEIVEEREDENT